MAKQKKVPSVQELKKRMMNRDPTHAPSAHTLDLAREENKALEKTVETLDKKLQAAEKKRLKPAEIRKSLDQILHKYGVEPAEELVKLALEMVGDTKVHVLDTAQRITIWRDLLQYRMPKLRATETHQTVDQTVTVKIQRFGDKSNDSGKTIILDAETIER